MELLAHLKDGSTKVFDKGILENSAPEVNIVKAFQIFKEEKRIMIDPTTKQELRFEDLKSIEIVFD